MTLTIGLQTAWSKALPSLSPVCSLWLLRTLRRNNRVPALVSGGMYRTFQRVFHSGVEKPIPLGTQKLEVSRDWSSHSSGQFPSWRSRSFRLSPETAGRESRGGEMVWAARLTGTHLRADDQNFHQHRIWGRNRHTGCEIGIFCTFDEKPTASS